MDEALFAGCLAALLVCDIVLPVLNAKQPRWYVVIGEWGIKLLTPPLVWLTRIVERLLR